MRKVLIITFLILANNIFAQGKWTPIQISIGSNCAVSHQVYSDCPNETQDVNWNKDERIEVTNSGSLKNYKRSKDSISFTFYDGNTSSISFELDSIHKVMYNISASYSSSSGNGESFSYQYDSLPFYIVGDTIIGSWTNMSCDFSHFYYRYEDSRGCNTVTRGHYGFHQNAFPLSSTYNGYLIFVVSDDTKSVSEKPINPLGIKISNDILSQSIYLSFPSLFNPQTLFIYDILGREAAREEISPGTTKYSIPSSKFRSGYYFARLGNMSGHFEVY